MNRYLTFEIIQKENLRKIKFNNEVTYIEYYSELLKRIDSTRLDKEIVRLNNILEVFTNKYLTEYKELDDNIYGWDNLVDALGMPEAEQISFDYNDLTNAISVTKNSIEELQTIQKQIEESLKNNQKIFKLLLKDGIVKKLPVIIDDPDNEKVGARKYYPNKIYTDEMHEYFDEVYKNSPNQDVAFEKLVKKYPIIEYDKRESFVKMHKQWQTNKGSKLPILGKQPSF